MEYRGPLADIEVPEVGLYETLYADLTESDAQRIAFDHAETGQVWTFGELKHHVDAAATWLDDHGLRRDDVLAVVLANCPEYAVAFHATVKLGAAITPVNVAASEHEVVRQLRVTGASWMMTQQSLLATARRAAHQAGIPDERLIVVAGTGPGTNLDELLATEPRDIHVDIDVATQVACLPVSSGTSGLPKAVRLSHRNLTANMVQFSEAIKGPQEHDSLVAFLPYSHIYALTTNLDHGIMGRHTQYTMSSFQAPLFLQLVHTRKPTLLFVVPPVATFLARSAAVDTVDWGSVRLVVSGAAPLDPVAGAQVAERLGTCVVQGYGMTELSPVTHVAPPGRTDISLDTIGLAIANVRFRVVDPVTGADVEPPAPGTWSEPGELWVAGPNAMLGYLDAPADQADVLDAEGFVHTGDLVRVDDRGVVKVVDRLKELIKRRGFQVAPAELEAELLLHPLVADAAVVGLGHRSGDQIPHALLVLRPGVDHATAPAEVLEWLNARTAHYKHVPSATVVESLPRSAAGKILRRELPGLVPGH